MNIVNHRKIYYVVSGILVLASIISLLIFGVNLGIDFKGGSIMEIEYQSAPPQALEVKEALRVFDVSENVRATGENGYIIRMKDLDQKEHTAILKTLSFNGSKPVIEKRFNSIGPLLGKEAVNKAFISILLVLICIVLFITYAFRRVSDPVSSWKYGLVAVAALFHDVLIPTGVFSVLGRFYGYEVDTLFVTALLVILGFSVHDTIVVFDRIRENLTHNLENKKKKTFDMVVGDSINETFTRSINTSLTTILALIVLYFAGAEATRHFSLALIIGIAAGTYSSIFIGSNLLVTAEKWQKRKK